MERWWNAADPCPIHGIFRAVAGALPPFLKSRPWHLCGQPNIHVVDFPRAALKIQPRQGLLVGLTHPTVLPVKSGDVVDRMLCCCLLTYTLAHPLDVRDSSALTAMGLEGTPRGAG